MRKQQRFIIFMVLSTLFTPIVAIIWYFITDCDDEE